MAEHTKKVHECVELLKPLADAFVHGDHEKIEELYHRVSKAEYEADRIKNDIRDQIAKVFLLSVGRHEVLKFLSAQDDVADAAQDFAVVLRLRKTSLHEELREDFQAFVDQVVSVSEQLLDVADDLAVLAEVSFEGERAECVLTAIEKISKEEWIADKYQHRFARHYYGMEDQFDPTTLVFYDRYCQTLGDVANCAEKCAKLLRTLIIGQ
ncbi:MAG: TIGR00153 family protein [Planctomycetes bacterium RBG_13_63_9]|nr:MAG: TIGR00153 family protein [Planctomycetes bacterium RBG_13_63_9]